MCRLAAYLGPPTSIARLVVAPTHSLVVQSYRPREMRHGVVNADGHGFGWYGEGGAPVRYTSVAPIWGDANLERLAAALRSGCIVAAVRSATPGMTFDQSNVQPFEHGSYLFLHNGLVRDFRARLMRRLRDSLRDEYYQAIRGGTDSEHLFALVLEALHGRPAGTEALLAGVREALARLGAWCREAGAAALLNLVLTDGERVIATRHAVADDAPSLYLLDRAAAWGGGSVIASERLDDDPGWQEVAPGELVVLDRDGARTEAL